MGTGTRIESHAKPSATHVPVERRLLVGDRRETWRGSRRDADWLRHFEVGTLVKREPSPVSVKTRVSVS